MGQKVKRPRRGFSKSRRLQLRLARERRGKRGETAPEVDVEENADLPQSALKRELLDSEPSTSIERAAAATSPGALLLHVDQLNGLISDLLCPDCRESKLKLEVGQGNRGFSSLILVCGAGECAYGRSVSLSPPLKEESVALDINDQISSVFAIPGIAHETDVKHSKTVSEMSTTAYWEEKPPLCQVP